MGQHKQALEIYVFKMKDYQKAEQYVSVDAPILHILTSIDTVTESTRLKILLHLSRTKRMMSEMILKGPRHLFTILFYRSIFNQHLPTSLTLNQHLICFPSMDHASQRHQLWALFQMIFLSGRWNRISEGVFVQLIAW